MKIKIYNESLEKFIYSLEKATVAKTLRTINFLEKFGRDLKTPHAKKISGGLFELRIRGKQEIRIFYTFFNSDIVLLHGFIKKSQTIPAKEIKVAKQRQQSLTSI